MSYFEDNKIFLLSYVTINIKIFCFGPISVMLPLLRPEGVIPDELKVFKVKENNQMCSSVK